MELTGLEVDWFSGGLVLMCNRKMPKSQTNNFTAYQPCHEKTNILDIDLV